MSEDPSGPTDQEIAEVLGQDISADLVPTGRQRVPERGAYGATRGTRALQRASGDLISE